MSHKSYLPLHSCIYRALRTLLKCPSSFSILVDISHDYHMTYSLNTFYKTGKTLRALDAEASTLTSIVLVLERFEVRR